MSEKIVEEITDFYIHNRVLWPELRYDNTFEDLIMMKCRYFFYCVNQNFCSDSSGKVLSS